MPKFQTVKPHLFLFEDMSNVYFNTGPAYARDYEGGHHDVCGDPVCFDVAVKDHRLKPASPARAAGRSPDAGTTIPAQPAHAKSPTAALFNPSQ